MKSTITQLSIIFGLGLLLILSPSHISAQRKSAVLNYEAAMARLNDIPTYLGNYRAQRSILTNRYNFANKYLGSIDQERMRMAMADLIETYHQTKTARSKLDDLWFVYYLAGWDAEDLLKTGWTQKQIDTGSPILKKKMGDLLKELVKIDKQYVTLDQTENLLIRMNVDIMEIIAGLHIRLFY